ncbi:MAG: tail fiber domain-containing protein, partial [Candidatus Omnitrophota bacterium]
GVYRELRAKRIAIGDDYIDGANYTWQDTESGSGEVDFNADLVVEGNVGIGTVNPGAKLEITDSAVDSIVGLKISNDARSFAWELQGNIGDRLMLMDKTSGTNPIEVEAGTPNDTLRLKSTGQVHMMAGNVGIGTGSPEAKLHVSGSGALTQDLLLVKGGGGSGNYKSLSVKSNSGDDLFYVNALSYNVIMGSSGAGNVGIGTTTPRGRLELNYGIDLPTPLASAVSGGLIIGDGSNVGAQIGIMRASSNNYNTFIQARHQLGISLPYNLLLQPLGGRVAIGTTDPGNGYLEVHGLSVLEILNHTGGSTSNYYTIYMAAGTNIGSVSSDAGWTRINFNTTSDYRLKENIAPTSRGLKELMSIPVDDFNFISDPGKKKIQGFIAQELYKAYPEAVTVGGNNPKTEPWMVDYARLTPLLVKSVQELKGENDSMKLELCRKDQGYSWCK